MRSPEGQKENNSAVATGDVSRFEGSGRKPVSGLSPAYVQHFGELRALNYDVCINTAILDTDFDYRINELSI